jgi:hypothetical protein
VRVWSPIPIFKGFNPKEDSGIINNNFKNQLRTIIVAIVVVIKIWKETKNAAAK